jgi:hypothetical protein
MHLSHEPCARWLPTVLQDPRETVAAPQAASVIQADAVIARLLELPAVLDAWNSSIAAGAREQ